MCYFLQPIYGQCLYWVFIKTSRWEKTNTNSAGVFLIVKVDVTMQF